MLLCFGLPQISDCLLGKQTQDNRYLSRKETVKIKEYNKFIVLEIYSRKQLLYRKLPPWVMHEGHYAAKKTGVNFGSVAKNHNLL